MGKWACNEKDLDLSQLANLSQLYIDHLQQVHYSLSMESMRALHLVNSSYWTYVLAFTLVPT